MAMDTAAKRKSAIAVGLICLRLGVVPDGSNLSAPQRLHTNGLYAGIAASASTAIDLTGITTALALMGVGH